MSDGTSTLTTLRIVVVALALGVVVLAAIAILVPVGVSGGGWLGKLAMPLALAGIVSPAIAYRVYLARRERVPRDAQPAVRARAMHQATVIALAITEFVALAGAVLFMATRDWATMLGVATHVLLAGAVWPSEERLDAFHGDQAGA